jgi:hypothetical protein
VLASSKEVGRGLVKGRRDVYVGHKLMELETARPGAAASLPAARACEIVHWHARGRPTPRPTPDGLSEDQRDRRFAKCGRFDEELRTIGLDPAPWPSSPTQHQREAFIARDRAWRKDAAARSLSVTVELSYDELGDPAHVAAMVSLILSKKRVPAGHEALDRELRDALRTMRAYPPPSPPRRAYVDLLRFARGESQPSLDALARLVAFTYAWRVAVGIISPPAQGVGRQQAA